MAVAQGAAAVEEGRQVEGGRQPRLAQIEVEVAGEQAAQVGALVDGVHHQVDAVFLGLPGDEFRRLHPLLVGGAHQEGGLGALGPVGAHGLDEFVRVVVVLGGQGPVVEGGQGRGRQDGGLGVAVVELRDDGLPVDDVGQGDAQLRQAEQALGDVEADVVHDGGGAVPQLVVAVVVHVGRGVGVGADHAGVAVLEVVAHVGGGLGGHQADARHAHRRVVGVLPPVAVAHQGAGVPLLHQPVGAGAHGGVGLHGAGLDDGDVQKQGEVLVGDGGIEDDGAVVRGLHGVEGIEALAVDRGILGRLEGGPDVPGGQPGAVAELHPGHQMDRILLHILGYVVVFAQHRLHLEAGGDDEQALVEQGGDGAVGEAGALVGVQAELRLIGQAEGADVGVLDGGHRIGDDVAAVGRRLVLGGPGGAAAQQRQAQEQEDHSFFQGASPLSGKNVGWLCRRLYQ